ncbi:hypothetical protein M9Y10_013520 [Tritrichomonas musculus]|uniref:NTP pyrophosphohydrolase MazG putative catalytic core domain-containing protein n=1 Tax=Tritrichomonas musculus TaxID=1915356 RepID=A0ABR2GN05_9EUKA
MIVEGENMLLEERLVNIINHYGCKHQSYKLEEECEELVKAIRDCIDYKENHDVFEVAEEIADVMVLIKQFQIKFSIPNKHIKNIMKYKALRQEYRIKHECDLLASQDDNKT